MKSGVAVHRADQTVHRRREDLSSRIIRRQGGPSVPFPSHEHVRAPGSSERLRLSRRPAQASLRQRRVDRGFSDGRSIRPDSGTFDGPFQEIAGLIKPAPGAFPSAPDKVAGFLLNHQVSRQRHCHEPPPQSRPGGLLDEKRVPANGKDYPAGTIYIPMTLSVLPILQKSTKDLGLGFEAADLKPAGEAFQAQAGPGRSLGFLRRFDGFRMGPLDFRPVRIPLRIGLRSGSRRGQSERQIRRPRFRRRRDSRVRSPGRPGRGRRIRTSALRRIFPRNFKFMVGRVSADKTIPQLQTFLDERRIDPHHRRIDGLGYHLGLPLANHLIEKTADGREDDSNDAKILCPGVDPPSQDRYVESLGAMGCPSTDIFFDNSPVFDLTPEAGMKGRQGRSLVREQESAAKRLGLGRHSTSVAESRSSRPRRERQDVSLRAGNHLPRPAARNFQIALQRDFLRSGGKRQLELIIFGGWFDRTILRYFRMISPCPRSCVPAPRARPE